jgi:hypothetical protein
MRPDLAAEIGPRIRSLSEVLASDKESGIRQKVTATLERLLADLPPDLRAAGRLAFALDREHRYPTLNERVATLAEQETCAKRTARRLMDRALHAMVTEADGWGSGALEPSPGPGWRLTSLTALFRLDSATPELYEMRRIVATRDLHEVIVRLGLPQTPDGQAPGEILVDALFGARVARVERQADRNHYRVVLTLPRKIPADREHEFWLRVVLPEGQPTWCHYAIVPLDPCEAGTVRVRFHPDRPPSEVWLLDEVPYLDLNDETAGPKPLQPDDNGDVVRRFSRLREGYGYGVAWTPAR